MRMKHLAAACGVALATLASAPALAVDGIGAVLAGSDVVLKFTPGTSTDPGGTTGIVTREGAVISGNVGSVEFGSGASYASTSDLGPGVIYFKNGNASSGSYTRSVSTTLVDITFENTGDDSVVPFLVSQIVPAGFGIFVGPGGCTANPSACNPVDPLSGDPPRSLGSFRPSGAGPEDPSNVLATAAFSFRIFADDFVAYELTGDLALVWGGGGGAPNQVFTNISQAERDLRGFRQESIPGAQDFIGFLWDTTDIDVRFADLLAPGDSATLRYETIVETSTRSDCFSPTRAGCLISYASFGDPVSRRVGGSTTFRVGGEAGQLSFQSFRNEISTFTDPPTGIFFDEFTFRQPVFNPRTGGVAFVLEGNAVPEPDNWALLIAGFGIVGAAMRQRRRLAA